MTDIYGQHNRILLLVRLIFKDNIPCLQLHGFLIGIYLHNQSVCRQQSIALRGWWGTIRLRTFTGILITDRCVKIKPAITREIYLHPGMCLIGIIPVPALIVITTTVHCHKAHRNAGRNTQGTQHKQRSSGIVSTVAFPVFKQEVIQLTCARNIGYTRVVGVLK
ncbi:hypothetical protein D3C86_1269630 [compost metagenome]